MPAVLDPSVHDVIISTMKAAFQDLPFYEKVIEPRLRTVISDAEQTEIDHRVHKRLSERYYNVAEFNKTESGKMMLTQIHIALRACYVLILAYHPDKLHFLWDDVSKLLAEYPDFQGQDDQELRYLLQFRNMMRLALLVVPPRMNKKLLINICARLEGSGKEYITGGGQKPCVNRRVLIYEREGNIQAEKRDDRPRHRDPDQLTGKKRPQLNTSFKRLKLIRIASEEARHLVRHPDGTVSRQNSYSTSSFGGFGDRGHSFGIRANSIESVTVDPRVFDDLMGTTPSVPAYRPAPPNFGRSNSNGSVSSSGSYPMHPMGHMAPPAPQPQLQPHLQPQLQLQPPSSYVIPGYQGYGGMLSMPAMQAPPYMNIMPAVSTMGAPMTYYPPLVNDPRETGMLNREETFEFASELFSRQTSEWIRSFSESHQNGMAAAAAAAAAAEEEEEAFPCGDVKEDKLVVGSETHDATSGIQDKNSRETSRSSVNFPPRFSEVRSRECSLNLGGNAGFGDGDLLLGFEESAILFPMLRAISWDASSSNFQEDLANLLRDD
jgi:hypothetical protein